MYVKVRLYRDTNTIVLYSDDETDSKATFAILCEGEIGTEIQTLSYCIMTMSMTQRQTLPSYVKVRLVQRYKHCRTVS